MPIPRPLSCAVFALAAGAGAALAQTADPPVVKPGDRWRFVEYYAVPSSEPNREWIVKAVTASRIEGTENGEPLVMTRELNVLESPRGAYTNPRALSFPLAVGAQWRYATQWVFKATGSTGTADTRVRVAAHERVNVPAGEFDAFKLESTASLAGMSKKGSRIEAEITSTYWYAPDARAIVKSITRNPYIGVTTFELVDFRPQR